MCRTLFPGNMNEFCRKMQSMEWENSLEYSWDKWTFRTLDSMGWGIHSNWNCIVRYKDICRATRVGSHYHFSDSRFLTWHTCHSHKGMAFHLDRQIRSVDKNLSISCMNHPNIWKRLKNLCSGCSHTKEGISLMFHNIIHFHMALSHYV